MSQRIFDLDLADLRTRISAKWTAYDPDVIPAWVAEMDLVPAEPIRAALADWLARGDTGYPTAGGYVGAFGDFAERRWGWQIDRSRARLAPDVMMGIFVVLLKVTSEGDAVVINDPVYPPFDSFPKLGNRRVIRAALTQAGRLDLAALEAAFGAASAGGARAAYLLSNPHNPTGVVHTPAELAAVAALADRYGVSVISDEVHAPVVYAGARFTSYLQVPGVERGFAVHSAAKAFSLAALKAGLVLAAPGEDAVLDQIAHGPNASLSGVVAHVAAFTHGDAWLDQVLAELDENRRLVQTLLAQRAPAIRVALPESTYLMWLDCRDAGIDGDPAAHFLREARVALNSGPTFGARGEGFARLNIATSPAILTELVDRIAASLP